MRILVNQWLLLGILLLPALSLAQKEVSDEPKMDYGNFLTKAPEALNMAEFTQQIYPKKAIENGITGKVVMNILVNQKGKVVLYHVAKDPSPVLTHAVSKKLKKLRFSAAESQGEKVSVWVQLPFDFQLEK